MNLRDSPYWQEHEKLFDEHRRRLQSDDEYIKWWNGLKYWEQWDYHDYLRYEAMGRAARNEDVKSAVQSAFLQYTHHRNKE